ncbi:MULTISPECIES: DUF1651 domain-containing protein [Prochlorococcus]|uniref:Uncharacterized protein n=1 Tax=Prochlorococcus marinus str. MIT 9116 TaxID=167544 RepID=A0A0A1ZUX1_PROMR|nr:DUF1651 domain-containing protein [Prochlorococcus marinus]KGF89780.1 hypothetical protein EU92_1571 [Prochlorococcus marinus str. MIT 9107]KGF92371.1 hypothetical protein EU93_0635 [Prochlorococcus marinus str. MIT 9116]KGF92689.1 hypothetical protein EU94_1688 [Prochlorococcus marinus str. MIT 9123]
MTSGVANVRTNFYSGNLIDPPAGWLFNQKSGLLIFFESYKKSVSNNLKVYTHLFYANELGEPAQLKNSRLHSIEFAFEKWNELISGGWQIVTSKFQ